MQPLQKSSKPSRRVCAEEVMGAIPPVIWYMRRQMRSNRGGLSMPQFRALVRVEREPLTSITAIAEHLATSLSTTSRLISGLVRRNFLVRETAPTDRRQARVSITPKGSAVLQAAREVTRRELEGVFSSLGSREHDRIIDAMRMLRRLFGSGVANASSASTASTVSTASTSPSVRGTNGQSRADGTKRVRSSRV